MTTTLKTLVLKTATVTSVKLAAPADRIGLGRVVAHNSADVQSPGQIPMPPCSGHRPSNSNAMRMLGGEQMTRLPGERERSGSSAHRWPESFPQYCEKPTKRPRSRASFPAVSCVSERIGDCQSSDRRGDRRTASTRETTPTAAAAQ